jgi:hypothetical protein
MESPAAPVSTPGATVGDSSWWGSSENKVVGWYPLYQLLDCLAPCLQGVTTAIRCQMHRPTNVVRLNAGIVPVCPCALLALACLPYCLLAAVLEWTFLTGCI